MKEILVAAKRPTKGPDKDQNDQGWEPIEFPLVTELIDEKGKPVVKDGEPVTETRMMTANPPGSGQLAAFMATSASFSSGPDRVAGAINFLTSVLPPEDHSYIVNRLFDPKDPFGAEHVTAIIEGLLEEWTGRPTGSPSGSTRSQRNGGRKSTRAIQAST